MRVLVTGGAGFIGSHLAERLIREGHEVRVMDHLSTGRKENVPPQAVFHEVDIRTPEVGQVFKDFQPQVISHCAAQVDVRRSVEDPLEDARSNILGLINILENAVKYGTRRVIFASSGGAIYGDLEHCPAAEGHPTRPRSPYGVSKLSGEHYLRFYQECYGLSYSSLRFSNVYGPRQDASGEAGVIAIFTRKILQGEKPVIHGDGRQTRDFVFVEDVVAAHMAVLDRDGQGSFNVGTSRETTVNHLYESLSQIVGSDPGVTHGPGKKGDLLRNSLDYSRLREQTGWEPRVSLPDGLGHTVDYFRKVCVK